AHVAGEVLVKVKDGQAKNLLSKKSLLGAQLKRELNLLSGQYVVLKSSAKSTDALLAQLKSLPEVDYAEPNFVFHAIGNSPSLASIIAPKIEQNFSPLTPN